MAECGGNGQVGESGCRKKTAESRVGSVSSFVSPQETAVNPDLNVIALFKGTERFIFVYDDDSREELFTTLRDAAADPSVALNWFDASVLTERARNQAVEGEESDPTTRLPTGR